MNEDKTYIGGSDQEIVIRPSIKSFPYNGKTIEFYQNSSQPITKKDKNVDYQFYSPNGEIIQTINSDSKWQNYWASQEAGKVNNAMNQAALRIAPTFLGLSNPLQFMLSIGGGYVGDETSRQFGYEDWGDMMSKKIGVNRTLGSFLNPGYYLTPKILGLKEASDNMQRRAIETAMRTSSFPNPFSEISLRNLGTKRLGSIAKYILTGKKTGPKGYSNSFASFKDLGYGTYWNTSYQGMGLTDEILEGNDMIDAFLYKKPISYKYGHRYVSKGNGFDAFDDYISKNYPEKAKDIVVYEHIPDNVRFSKINTVPEKTNKWIGDEKYTQSTFKQSPLIVRNASGFITNVGGHMIQTADGDFIRAADIWKFNPDEYIKRWLPELKKTPIKRFFIKQGLKRVDKLGTPVITKTPWLKVNY